MAAEKISLATARRIALAAQGFADPRPNGRVDRRHFRRVLDRMGLIQIDSVNVLVRSQELPLFARLGPHPRSMIGDATKAGEVFEYWVHEASHVDMAQYHLHRWQMAGDHKWQRYWTLTERRPGFIDEVYRRIVTDGPVASGDLAERVGKKGTWWDWDDGKIALEHLFWDGRIAATRRPSDFARLYDLTERVIPAEVLARPAAPERDARKQLLALAARHHGIGTFTDLTDYHRQKNAPCKPLIGELVEEGTLSEVHVEGWTQPAYLHRDARVPRRINACALSEPVRPGRMESRQDTPPVRVPLPHRDLHTAAQAHLRLLRAADPVGRQRRRSARHEGRPARWGASRAGFVRRTRRPVGPAGR